MLWGCFAALGTGNLVLYMGGSIQVSLIPAYSCYNLVTPWNQKNPQQFIQPQRRSSHMGTPGSKQHAAGMFCSLGYREPCFVQSTTQQSLQLSLIPAYFGNNWVTPWTRNQVCRPTTDVPIHLTSMILKCERKL